MADYIPKSEGELLAFLNNLDEEGTRARAQYAKAWEHNVRVMRGNFWPEAASPMFSVNIVAPAIARKSGLLTETKPILDIRTRRDGFMYTADVLKHTISAIWDEQSVGMSLEELAWFLANFGCGLFKTSYDQLADYGIGNVCVVPTDPRMIIIDPSVVKAFKLEETQYLREEYIVPLSWCKERFPKTAKDLRADNNLMILGNESYKISWLQRAVNKLYKKNRDGEVESAIPRVYIREYWIADPSTKKDGGLLYPGMRRIFRTGDDTILNPDTKSEDIANPYGQQNPYFDGMLPYDMLDNEPDSDHPWGHSEVDKLKKINEAFNRVGNTTVSTLIKNLEWVIADNNAMKQEDVSDLKRYQAVVVEIQPGRKVERIAPTQPTTTNMDFLRLMISLVEMQAGLSDGAMQGKGRVELRSQPQLEGLQQVAQVLIRNQARRMESFLERVGQKLVSRIFQFYTDDRIMTYVDKDQLKIWQFKKDDLRKEILQQVIAEKEEEALKETQENVDDGKEIINAFVKPKVPSMEEIETAMKGAWKLFRFKILPLSSLASNRVARAGQLLELAGQGMIPPSMALSELGFDNYTDLLQKFKVDLDARAAAGVPPPQPPQAKGGKKKAS